MKKWWLIPLFLILLAVIINAKCNDNFCDPNENCESCPDDCLCTEGPHNEKIKCCNDFSCQECELGYCHDRECNGLEGFTSIFQKIKCFDTGSIEMEIKFQELYSITLTPDEDLKVYMKEKNNDASFSEIKGKWTNPKKEGVFRYTKIFDTSYFNSDKDMFESKGEYYVRVKYKMGRGDGIFEDAEVTCPGISKEPVTMPDIEEPEIEEVEPPREETTKKPSEEIIVKDIPKEVAEPKEKSNLLLYIIITAVILVAIIFFLKYKIKISKKNKI